VIQRKLRAAGHAKSAYEIKCLILRAERRGARLLVERSHLPASLKPLAKKAYRSIQFLREGSPHTFAVASRPAQVLAWALISFACGALEPQAVTYADSSGGKKQTGAAGVYAKKAGDDTSQVFETVVKPMIRQNCASCHNPVKLKGDLDLEQFLSQPSYTALRSREIFELLVQKLAAGEMPPPGMPRPSREQIQKATAWIQQQYALLDAKTTPDPGRVTARRLNRYEYNNSVRDLVAVNLRFSNDFPPDPYGYGFDNIGDVLTLSPILTERYLKAAERVAQAAIPTDAPQQGLSVRYESQALGQQSHMHVQTTHDFPVDGFYNLRVGWEQGVGNGTHLTCHGSMEGRC
jgi:mono/diheme cytochrome c family protein